MNDLLLASSCSLRDFLFSCFLMFVNVENFNLHTYAVENYKNIRDAFSKFFRLFYLIFQAILLKFFFRFLGKICLFLFSNNIKCSGTTKANVYIVLFGISIVREHVLKGMILGIKFFFRNERRNRFRYFLKIIRKWIDSCFSRIET